MRPGQLYRRTWTATASLVTFVLAVAGMVMTPTARWPTLLAALTAGALGGAAWSATERGHVQTDARRVAALAALTILVAVGAGHLGSAAVLAVALVAVTCPWLSEALMGRPRRQRR